MSDTPRTDAAIKASDGQWSFVIRDLAREMERELAAEREQVAILRSDEKRLVQFAKTYRLRADETEAKLEQERQDRKQANLDALRAFGERNDASAIIDATLKALPVGYIPAHTPESLPGRVADLVSELAVWKHEVETLRDQLKAEHETAISLFIELHELKQREP